MEHIYKNMHEYVQKMYVQRGDLEANVRTINGIKEGRDVQLDVLADEYITSRDVDAPTRYDLNWIDSRIGKIPGLTSEGFINYCKYRRNKK